MPYQWHLPPLAWSAFKLRYPADGVATPGLVGTRDQVETVNARVNKIAAQVGFPTAEEWLLWPSRAWCHDYAVTKRHELLKAGFPASVLLLEEVKTRQGEGHLILNLRTDRGCIVLDNLTPALMDRSGVSYTRIKHQSPADPGVWTQ